MHGGPSLSISREPDFQRERSLTLISDRGLGIRGGGDAEEGEGKKSTNLRTTNENPTKDGNWERGEREFDPVI